MLGSHSQKGPITLTLAKFSHCSIAAHNRPTTSIPWKHLTGQNDLFCVFDSVRRLDVSEQIVSKDFIKIVYGQDCLV